MANTSGRRLEMEARARSLHRRGGGPDALSSPDGRPEAHDEAFVADREERPGPDQASPGGDFDDLPFGLLVMSPGGTLVMANAQARRLLLRAGRRVDLSSTRCCELFGCRRNGSRLHDACFAEILAGDAAGSSRLEIKPTRAGSSRLSLTAVVLRHDDSLIVFKLVDGTREPGRAPEPTEDEGAPSLRITTLGRTRVSTASGSIGGAWLEQRAGELLHYLVCERRRPVHADEIAEAIWPHGSMSSVGNVRFAIHDLRNRLEPGRARRVGSGFIVSSRGRYQLDSSRVEVDADELELLIAKGVALLAAGRSTMAAAALDRALGLYEGEFLIDAPYATWAALERSRLQQAVIKALRLRTDLAREAGEVSSVFALVGRLARMEPFDAEIQREWISTCLMMGRYGEASRNYDYLRKRMMREFGRRPPFELADLLDESERHRLSSI